MTSAIGIHTDRSVQILIGEDVFVAYPAYSPGSSSHVFVHMRLVSCAIGVALSILHATATSGCSRPVAKVPARFCRSRVVPNSRVTFATFSRAFDDKGTRIATTPCKSSCGRGHRVPHKRTVMSLLSYAMKSVHQKARVFRSQDCEQASIGSESECSLGQVTLI